jgi:hypothetical protein
MDFVRPSSNANLKLPSAEGPPAGAAFEGDAEKLSRNSAKIEAQTRLLSVELLIKLTLLIF